MPRSPSRDLSDRYTGTRGYFRTPDAIRRGKYALAAIALMGAGAWAAVDVLRPSKTAYAHSHGPVANPHAAFDDNCAACHASYGVGDAFSANALNVRDRWHTFTCGKCHAGSDDPNFAHHASANEKARAFHERCSNCHHDHLGRDHSLVRLSDANCTHCHANLGGWHDAAKSKAGKPYENKITNFVSDHPDFRSLKIEEKPRALKFSHAVHMNPGQAYSPGGKEAMTVETLRKLGGPDAVARYAPPGAKDGHVIQLECASCHKLDAGAGTAEFDSTKAALGKMGEPTKSLLPPRASGAYFLPINFEAQCRSCHPLAAPDGSVDVGDKKYAVPGFSVAHRQQPASLVGELKAGYLKGLIEGKNPLLAQPAEPGGVLDAPPPAGKSQALGDVTERLAAAARPVLLSADAGCMKCHIEKEGAEKGDLPRITPVPDRTVWFEHAKFNHAAHRGATCTSCHPGTGGRPITPTDANKPEPVQILGIDSCRACHSPSSTKVTVGGVEASGGGIRHNCTDCHTYHHGDLPLQGRGSAARNPAKQRDIADWLKGK